MRKPGTHAFTLIEMLVVIAIIALLASIITPAVTGALKKAKSTACQSHLRQFGTAFVAYAMDHNTRLPYQQRDSSTTWHVEVAPYLEGFTNQDFVELAQEGGRPPGVYACPASDNRIRSGNYSDFGMNFLVNDYGPSQNSPQRMLDQVPGSVILLGDSVNCGRRLSIYSENGGLDPRHPRNSANLLHVDGSVKSGNMQTLFTDIQGDKRKQPPWGWGNWRN